jgi:hypothetical protein
MTAVHPPRPAIDEAHLIAWTAGWLAAATTYEHAHRAELAAAYEAGRRNALHAVAVNAAELDIITGPALRHVRSEAAKRVRNRRADMEAHARETYQREGRAEYRGGPVAWDNGDAA